MAPAEPPSAATVWLRMGTTFDTSAMRRRGSPCAAAIAARSPAPPPPTTTTSAWTVCINPPFQTGTGPSGAIRPPCAPDPFPRDARGSGYLDRDLSYFCAPFPRPRLMCRVAGRVHRDSHRHVLHLELVNRLHAQIVEREHSRSPDCLRHQVGCAAYRDEVNTLVLLDHLHRVRAALRFSDRAQH